MQVLIIRQFSLLPSMQDGSKGLKQSAYFSISPEDENVERHLANFLFHSFKCR